MQGVSQHAAPENDEPDAHQAGLEESLPDLLPAAPLTNEPSQPPVFTVMQ